MNRTIAQVENFFLSGFNKSYDLRQNNGESRPLQIVRMAAGIFIGLLTLPLAGVGLCINRLFRKKIDKEVFKKEFDAWNKIFHHYDYDQNFK